MHSVTPSRLGALILLIVVGGSGLLYAYLELGFMCFDVCPEPLHPWLRSGLTVSLLMYLFALGLTLISHFLWYKRFFFILSVLALLAAVVVHAYTLSLQKRAQQRAATVRDSVTVEINDFNVERNKGSGKISTITLKGSILSSYPQPLKAELPPALRSCECYDKSQPCSYVPPDLPPRDRTKDECYNSTLGGIQAGYVPVASPSSFVLKPGEELPLSITAPSEDLIKPFVLRCKLKERDYQEYLKFEFIGFAGYLKLTREGVPEWEANLHKILDHQNIPFPEELASMVFKCGDFESFSTE